MRPVPAAAFDRSSGSLGADMACSIGLTQQRVGTSWLGCLGRFRLVTEVPVHAGRRCNSGRSETLLWRPRRFSPETLTVFSVLLRLNTQDSTITLPFSFTCKVWIAANVAGRWPELTIVPPR